jgi:hypothetical protein
VTWLARIRGRQPSPFRARDVALIVAGLVIIPSLIAVYFGALGAWPNLAYCVFRFNRLVTATRSPMMILIPRLLYIPLIIITLRIAWRYRQTTTNARFFFAVATPIFLLTLGGFWILISPRDFLPIIPFVSIFSLAALERRRHFIKYAALLIAVSLIAVGYYTQWLTNRTREFITLERQVLTLTHPGEPLMDYKGETIYRRRPYYFILEFITRNAIMRGLLPDTVAADVVHAGCHVAQADGTQWPDHARAFLSANFLDLGRLRASGQWLRRDGSFSIAVPGEYVILRKEGEAGGFLDGTPYHGARVLAAGMHTFASAQAGGRLACLWAPAFARGYSPFHLRDLDF